ncbi:MAG: hypothetical protein H7Z11_21125 [Verrucomicrobia bacterium]|nr:hypothetical protein [Leptolyngbya sp. ES-bin-22]
MNDRLNGLAARNFQHGTNDSVGFMTTSHKSRIQYAPKRLSDHAAIGAL